MVGNNVSHANNKTKRRFLPNLQHRRFWVESENRWVSLRLTNAALRTIDKNGIEAVLFEIRARGDQVWIMTPGRNEREKIKLESSAGTGHFYTTKKNKQPCRKKLRSTSSIPLPASTSCARKPS